MSDKRKKRKSPKEIIESGNKETEQAYVKFPKKELIKISKEEDEYMRKVISDVSDIEELSKDNNYKKHFHLHTHINDYNLGCALPSMNDLISSHNENALFNSKGSIIAQRDFKTGELQGYTIFLKQKEEDYGNSIMYKIRALLWGEEYGAKDFKKDFQFQLNKYEQSVKKGPKEIYSRLKEFCKIEGLSLRFVPAKGYYFNQETGNFEIKGNSLENKVVSGLFGIITLAGLYFGISGISGTGAAIGITNSSSGFLGVLLFVSGIAGLFFSRK